MPATPVTTGLDLLEWEQRGQRRHRHQWAECLVARRLIWLNSVWTCRPSRAFSNSSSSSRRGVRRHRITCCQLPACHRRSFRLCLRSVCPLCRWTPWRLLAQCRFNHFGIRNQRVSQICSRYRAKADATSTWQSIRTNPSISHPTTTPKLKCPWQPEITSSSGETWTRY